MANEYNYQKIFELLISKISINPVKNVFGITFVAGPGFGKSTVAEMLSKKLGIVVTSNDYIRRLYDSLNFDNEAYEADIKKMANERTKYMLKNKTPMIIDANMEFFWQMAEKNFNDFGAKLYFVELLCSEDTVISRIKSRAESFENTSNLSRAGLKEYQTYLNKKRASTFPRDKVYFKIDMNKSLDEIEAQVDKLVEKIRKENKLQGM